MQRLRFLYEEFYIFAVFLNMLHQSLIKNSRVKDARPSLFTQRILHFTSFLSTLYQSLIKIYTWKMLGFRFIREEFYILQHFKHARPIID